MELPGPVKFKRKRLQSQNDCSRTTLWAGWAACQVPSFASLHFYRFAKPEDSIFLFLPHTAQKKESIAEYPALQKAAKNR